MERQDSRNQLCVTPRRKRTWEPGSITNAYTSKRRRVSMASVDLSREIDSTENMASTSKPTVADRFISAPQESSLPLNVTPRTKRIARMFGLANDRVLNFADAGSGSSSSHLSVHRSHIQRLFPVTPKVSPISAAAHLGSTKKFILALDAPGIPLDPFSHPLSWSSQNQIAVACGRDLYFQDLETRAITHLGTLSRRRQGHLVSIEWSHDAPSTVGVGTSTGYVQLWDTCTRSMTEQWRISGSDLVCGMDWNRNVLAVGSSSGGVDMYDVRQPSAKNRIQVGQGKVHGVRWSLDGTMLATSDSHGVVQVWDARASKFITANSRMGSKMQHDGAHVKALAWCPWKSDILATGSTFPDGKIRLWSVKPAPTPEPLHTISLNTSVTSLIWSPHCKELLSTHGSSWQYRSASLPALLSSDPVLPRGAVPVKTMYTNSVTVHAYPSLERVASVTAHSSPVGHSCLSPDGTKIFTICPAEETMKMWQIWSTPKRAERRESIFDKYGIR